MRVVFLGSPLDAVAPLHAVAAEHVVVAVITQPDRRRGRGGATMPSPVKAAALELGLEVWTPAKAREVVDALGASGAELGVVVAFGQLLAPAVLDALPRGFVNVHFSLLPRWRGAAPVERAILAGDAETGVGIMALEEGLDTGPIYAETRTPIGEHESAGELRARLVGLGTPLLLDALATIADATPRAQVGEPTYADKLDVAEFQLDWTRPAAELDRVVRAGNPRPGAWTTLGGKRLKLLRAQVTEPTDARPGELDDHGTVATGAGALRLLEIQPAGKAAMTFEAFRTGHRGAVVLGT